MRGIGDCAILLGPRGVCIQLVLIKCLLNGHRDEFCSRGMKIEPSILSPRCSDPVEEKRSPSFITKQREKCRGRKHLAAGVLIQLRERRGPGSGESLTLPLPKTPMPPISPTPKGIFQGSLPGPVRSVGQGGPLPVPEDTTVLSLLLPPPLYLSEGVIFPHAPSLEWSFLSTFCPLDISACPVSRASRHKTPKGGLWVPHPVPPASPPGPHSLSWSGRKPGIHCCFLPLSLILCTVCISKPQ